VMMLMGNIFVVIFIYGFSPVFGMDSLPLGIVGGIALQTILLVVAISPKRSLFFGRPTGSINWKEVGTLMWPLVALEFLFAINNAADYALASNHSGQIIASLNYSMILFRIPTIVVGMSLGTTLLARLSENHAEGKMSEFVNASTLSLRLGVYFLIPFSALVFLFSEDIVRLAFQRGVFDEESVMLTSGFLKQLSPSILLVTVYFFLSKMMNVLNLNLKLISIFLVALIIKIAVYFIFVGYAGHVAVLISINAAYISLSVGMLLILNRKIHGVLTLDLLLLTLKLLVLCSIAIIAAFIVNRFIGALTIVIGSYFFRKEREYFLSKIYEMLPRPDTLTR
jgi:putative peptidoglycan lipid II flippase